MIRTYSGCSSTTPARDMDEQAVLPLGRVVRSELLVRADELAEQLVVAERLEADAVRRPLDLDPALADKRRTGRVQLEHRRRRGTDAGAVHREGRVETLEVGEPPRLVVVVGIGSAR